MQIIFVLCIIYLYPGYIGKLKLQIPVRYIKSQPWVIQIDQLYVVAGPAQPAPVSLILNNYYTMHYIMGVLIKVFGIWQFFASCYLGVL